MLPDNAKTIDGLIKKYNLTSGAELGVRRGEFTSSLLKGNPNLNMICVDVWANDPSMNERHRHDQNYNAFLDNIKGLESRIRIIKKLTTIAAEDIPNSSLGFIFIDATHTYGAVKKDIELWAPKVIPGGIISGHDFHKEFDKGGVIRAITEKFGQPEKFSENVKDNVLYVDEYTCWFVRI